ISMDRWICNAAALKKVIAAVGRKYTGNLDCDRLAFDLQGAWSKWLLFTALDSDKGARARKELFKPIAASAVDFRKQLLDPRGDMYTVRSLFRDRSRFDAFVVELDRIIGEAKGFAEQNSRGGWVRLGRSPKEWMVAEVLPEIFHRNFHRR